VTGPAEPAREEAPAFWRSFLVYTASRVGVFAVLLGLLFGIGVRGVIVILIALVLSGVLSYFLLDRQRSAFAIALQERVERRQAAAAARAATEDDIADAMIAAEQARQRAHVGDDRGA
jgi:uncharacterized membrane protein